MRAGLSTIQQTLTPEAASVLNHSIAEAGRRNHGQTTPLHVAATLLASPSGFLRQACIKSHPNSSHPLQCRALELCFSVALERLPTSQSTSPSAEPPISNALMAALKRAQAHQRRGYPEQQQQPLLAVKVELEQLIISILDDPSVSRVMREASFSSPAVKATIEQSLNSASPAVNSGPIGLGFRPAPVAPSATPSGRSLYLNPRLQQGGAGPGAGAAAQLGQQQRGEEVKRVVDILMRKKKRNPILVGESEPEATVREVLRKIESKELGEGAFGIVGFNAHVVHLEKELPSEKAQIPGRLKELGDLIEARIGSSGGCGGVFVNLGDLKWLVDQPAGFGVGGGQVQQVPTAEVGRAAVAEMGRLVAKFGEGGAGRLWLLGTATCETYLRCQVYHPSMENDWDLQAVPITNRTPIPGMFPRLGSNGILGTSLESLSPLKAFPTSTITLPRRASENTDPTGVSGCCPQCAQNYEQELADILKENEKSDTESKSEAARPALPQWLQKATNNDNAKVTDQAQSNSQAVNVKKRTQDLQKKWHDACLSLHPKFHQQSVSTERIAPTPFSMTGLYNVNLLGHQFQPKIPLNKNLGSSLQLSSNPTPTQPSELTVNQQQSLVTTELVLGQTKPSDTNLEETHKERINDFLNCLPSKSPEKFDELKSKKLLDADSFKKLLKSLTEKVWWQQDAASVVATTVSQCKLGNGKRRQVGAKGDLWLLFMGPDRVGKKKMAAALSELVSASNPIVISLAQRRGDGDSDVHLRGKTALDRIAEAIRRNPQSVIMLEDIDEANILIRGSIKRAMEQGRFTDSHGREISLGNVMFILTANWLPEDLSHLSNGTSLDEEKLANVARGGWQLRLSVAKRASKRRPSWLSKQDRSLKPRKETNLGLSFDLNEAADAEEDRGDGSLNSSDLTVDHEDNHVLHNVGLQTASASVPRELLDSVDDAIVFKPVNFDLLRTSFSTSIAKRFSTIAGNGISIEVQEGALEKIASGVWLGQTNITEWMEKVLVPSFHQLKKTLNSGANDLQSSLVVRLEDDGYSDCRSSEEWLPSAVRVVAEEY